MSEMDSLIFGNECPFFDECEVLGKLQEERGKRVQLEHRIEEFKEDFAKILHRVTETLALRHYVDRLMEIPEVESIYLHKIEENLDIWTVISVSDLDIEEKIAQVQCELMRVFHSLQLDFMVLPRNDNEIRNLLPEKARQIYTAGG